jgi:hypothetical protein
MQVSFFLVETVVTGTDVVLGAESDRTRHLARLHLRPVHP